MIIRRIEPRDQHAAQALINAGLGEHFGHVDPSMNPDLNDIAASFASGAFLVAELDGAIVGTGGYKRLDAQTAQLERVSVHPAHRRTGMASRIVSALIDHARAAGASRVVLETTSTWSAVVAFWRRNGFRITHHVADQWGGQTWFERVIAPPPHVP